MPIQNFLKGGSDRTCKACVKNLVITPTFDQKSSPFVLPLMTYQSINVFDWNHYDAGLMNFFFKW